MHDRADLTLVGGGIRTLIFLKIEAARHHVNMSVLCIPLIPHFYIVKLGVQGYSFFLIFALKHRLWLLVRTASMRRF